jgi:hypothetical protein
MTKPVASRVIKSVPLRGKDILSSIRWLKRKPVGTGRDERLAKSAEVEKNPVLYSNQFSLSVEDLGGNSGGHCFDYYA